LARGSGLALFVNTSEIEKDWRCRRARNGLQTGVFTEEVKGALQTGLEKQWF
jgi:hypothetical protein